MFSKTSSLSSLNRILDYSPFISRLRFFFLGYGFFLFALLFAFPKAHAQGGFWQPASSFNPSRFWSITGGGAAAYGGSLILLNNVWYKQYPRSKFHLFDDHGEWLQMDKAGHILTAYTETGWVYGGFKWAGVKPNQAVWAAAATGILLQTGIEILDGYSAEWGFSWSDMAANTIGALLFASQQSAWGEQRMVLKVSNTPIRYSVTPIPSLDGTSNSSLKERANDLFGDNYTQTFFKDYNAVKVWVSVNPDAYLPADAKLHPSWLSVSFGYGAGNLFGGYQNKWVAKNGAVYELNEKDFPRFRMVLFSLDVDLARIPVKDPFVKGLFNTINFIKIPSPTLEIGRSGKVRFRWLYF